MIRRRRLSKAVSATGVTTTYSYDGAQVVAEYDNGVLSRQYLYGPGLDEPIALIVLTGPQAGIYFYAFDGLGSATALSQYNTSLGYAEIKERYAYDAFGQVRILTSGFGLLTSSQYGNPVLFTGRRLDAESGLYDYRARMYSPALGRFMQPDPIGYADAMNLYQYCGNNPVNFIDPWGEARRQKRPLDTFGVRHITVGPFHHDRFLYNDGTDSGYYDDSRVRKDRANQKLQNRYVNMGPELDDRILRQAEKNVRRDWDRITNPDVTRYKLTGDGRKNCQDYCDAVEQEYERLMNEEELVRKLMQPTKKE